jgi:hypothetical protein
MNTTREGHAFTLTNFGHGLPTCLLKAERCPTTINRYIFADQICFHAVPKKNSLKDTIFRYSVLAQTPIIPSRLSTGTVKITTDFSNLSYASRNPFMPFIVVYIINFWAAFILVHHFRKNTMVWQVDRCA